MKVENIAVSYRSHRSCIMRNPDLAYMQNKGADQLCDNFEADQWLCFCFKYSTITLLLEFEVCNQL